MIEICLIGYFCLIHVFLQTFHFAALQHTMPSGFTPLLKAADIEKSWAEFDGSNEDMFFEEFCDVCNMELIDHTDERPCNPDNNS